MRTAAVPLVLNPCPEWLNVIPFLLTPFQFMEEKGNPLPIPALKFLMSRSVLVSMFLSHPPLASFILQTSQGEDTMIHES